MSQSTQRTSQPMLHSFPSYSTWFHDICAPWSLQLKRRARKILTQSMYVSVFPESCRYSTSSLQWSDAGKGTCCIRFGVPEHEPKEQWENNEKNVCFLRFLRLLWCRQVMTFNPQPSTIFFGWMVTASMSVSWRHGRVKRERTGLKWEDLPTALTEILPLKLPSSRILPHV